MVKRESAISVTVLITDYPFSKKVIIIYNIVYASIIIHTLHGAVHESSVIHENWDQSVIQDNLAAVSLGKCDINITVNKSNASLTGIYSVVYW